jgi:hypothetical protein
MCREWGEWGEGEWESGMNCENVRMHNVEECVSLKKYFEILSIQKFKLRTGRIKYIQLHINKPNRNKKKYNRATMKENVQGLLGTFQFDLPKTERNHTAWSQFFQVNRVFKLIPPMILVLLAFCSHQLCAICLIHQLYPLLNSKF